MPNEIFSLSPWLLYLAVVPPLLWLHLHRRRRREAHAREVLQQSVDAGLTEPVSLHPVIDPTICVGSGSCVRVCPEGTLGIIDGKAYLVNPTVCIGHGACAASCPVTAIKLVFGTERRGVDIPYVKPSFETNVDGIYVAGELGGMGLVRKAAEQGRQAIESISRNRADGDQLDVVIVGAGPAGLSASLAAMERKLRFATLEQEEGLGGTVYHYPRRKVVLTQPVALPLAGKLNIGEISKEALLQLWQGLVDRFSIPINFGERLEKITPLDPGYEVKTSTATYRTRALLLTIGRRGTPRKLGVPGEERSKVVYRLIDAEQYRGRNVLVVGGGDSAIEAALAVAAEPGSRVTLSYRGDAFQRLKPKNRERLAAAEAAKQLTVALRSNVIRIDERHVQLEREGQTAALDNDAVVICAGGILPNQMLKDLGVKVETKFGTE